MQKVIEFGCQHPREGLEVIADQISLAHRYYNRLIELHRSMREEFEAARRRLFPDLERLVHESDAADAAVTAIVDEIRAANASAKRKRATREESDRLTAAKAARKELWARLKEMRATIKTDDALRAEFGRIGITYRGTVIPGANPERRNGGKFKDARAASGVYWGTYLKVEASVEASVNAVNKEGTWPPAFRRWDGCGLVGVHSVGGMTWEDIVSGRCTLMRAEPLPSGRTSARRARPWLISIRVQSDEKGKPIWAKIPAWVRTDQIPYDAIINNVALVRRQCEVRRYADGYRPYYDWSLQLTITADETKPHGQSGSCGIDLGWRLKADGSLRVAVLVDDIGQTQELTLPKCLLDRWSKAESLQSLRDTAYNEAKAALVAWKQSGVTLPEWFSEEAKAVGQWRSPGKFARLLDRWEKERIPGDETILPALQQWRARDVHLWQYQGGTREAAMRIRKDLYRKFAASVRLAYARVYVEDCDWRSLQRRPAPDDNRNHDAAREYMRIASVGMLREFLLQDGAAKMPAAHTTPTCHACGHVGEWDRAAYITHTCEQCGTVWDQDENAAKNLLARGIAAKAARDAARGAEGEQGAGDAAIVPAKGGRWARRKAARSQKDAKDNVAADVA